MTHYWLLSLIKIAWIVSANTLTHNLTNSYSHFSLFFLIWVNSIKPTHAQCLALANIIIGLILYQPLANCDCYCPFVTLQFNYLTLMVHRISEVASETLLCKLTFRCIAEEIRPMEDMVVQFHLCRLKAGSAQSQVCMVSCQLVDRYLQNLFL